MSRRLKKSNDYAVAGGLDLYADIPKAVWAAIAVSRLTSGGEDLEYARGRVLQEWEALADNGIVDEVPRFYWREIEEARDD